MVAGIALVLLRCQASVAGDPQPTQPSISTHNYGMVDHGTYGYQAALSEEEIRKGVATKPLIMMRYLGNRDGTYIIQILGSSLNNQGVVNRVSCQAPCEFAKSEIISGGVVLSTQMLPVTPNSVVGAMLQDAVLGQLVPFGQRSNNNQMMIHQPEVRLHEPAVRGSSPTQASAVEPGLCVDIKTCIAASLVVAREGDVDGLHRLATRMDSVAKPTVGDKASARNFNKQALEAIGRGDLARAESLLSQAYAANPRDVEVAANYGLTLVNQRKSGMALDVLKNAVLLDPRRTSTWVPLAMAYNAQGDEASAVAALWIAYQWSTRRDSTIAFYAKHATATPPDPMASVYGEALAWVRDGKRPSFLGSATSNTPQRNSSHLR